MLETKFVFKGIDFQIYSVRPVFYAAHALNRAIIESGMPTSHTWTVRMSAYAAGTPLGCERFSSSFVAPAIKPGNASQGADIAKSVLAYWAETMWAHFKTVEASGFEVAQKLLPPAFATSWTNDFTSAEGFAQLTKRIEANTGMTLVGFFGALCGELVGYKQQALKLTGAAHWMLEPFGDLPSVQYGILHVRNEPMLAYAANLVSATPEALIVRFDRNEAQPAFKTLRGQVTKRANQLRDQLKGYVEVEQPDFDDVLSVYARLASYQQDNDGFLSLLYDRDAKRAVIALRYRACPYVSIGTVQGSDERSFQLVFVSPVSYPRNPDEFAAFEEKYQLTGTFKVTKVKE